MACNGKRRNKEELRKLSETQQPILGTVLQETEQVELLVLLMEDRGLYPTVKQEESQLFSVEVRTKGATLANLLLTDLNFSSELAALETAYIGLVDISLPYTPFKNGDIEIAVLGIASRGATVNRRRVD